MRENPQKSINEQEKFNMKKRIRQQRCDEFPHGCYQNQYQKESRKTHHQKSINERESPEKYKFFFLTKRFYLYLCNDYLTHASILNCTLTFFKHIIYNIII